MNNFIPNNNSFCVIPWIHIHTYPNGNATPCCVWDNSNPVGNVNKNSIQEIAKSNSMNYIRKQMLDGNIVSSCYQCNAQTKSGTGQINFKKMYNTEFSYLIEDIRKNTNIDGSLKNEFEMKYMNIRYSNLCNFACRSCGPMHSSLWGQEQNIPNPVKKIIEIKPNYLNEIFENLKTVDSINFAGGESLLIPQHWEILDKLIELNRLDVRIRYVTNLSKLNYNKKNIIDYAKKFKNFKFMISIDASHERAEYYRYGTVWKEVEDNLRIVNESNVNFFINCTVGATNVWHVPDLHKFLIKSNLVKNNFYLNLLIDGKFMSTKILPKWYKEEVVNKIFLHKRWLNENNYKINSDWDDLVQFMKSEDYSYLLGEFIRYNKNLDIIRNQNLEITFPELKRVIS